MPITPPVTGSEIALVAGEASGDLLASLLLGGLNRYRPGLSTHGIGGPKMMAQGFRADWSMEKLAVRGYVEVLRHYREITGIRRALREQLLAHPPAMFIGVDAPDFNLDLETGLKQAGIKTVHFVGPSIWAWRGKRVEKIRRATDLVLCIFPFEPAVYADTKLDARFVGHPFAEPGHQHGLSYDPEGPVLLLPGSRPKPVRKIFPALVEAFALFRKDHPKRRALVLHTGGEVHAELYRLLAEYGDQAKGIDLRPVSEGPAAGCAALVSSGTMSLTVALAGIPGAVVYRANLLTWIVGRRLIAGRVDNLGIANILLKRQAWPEYLQGACEPEPLAARLRECVDAPGPRAQALADAGELLRMLSAQSGSTPAEWVATFLPK